MQNNRKAIIMAAVLFVIALLVTVYPVISNYLSEKNKSVIRTEYFNAINELDNSAIEEARHKAEKYNAMLSTGVSQAFSDEQLNEAFASYDELLNLNGDGTMSYTVSEIQVIDPNDVKKVFIQDGRELLTLLTCHPYASGGQYRYLVICERSAP